MKDAPQENRFAGDSIRGTDAGSVAAQTGSRAIGRSTPTRRPRRAGSRSRAHPPTKVAVAAVRQSRINMTNGLSPCYGFDYYRRTAPPEGRRQQGGIMRVKTFVLCSTSAIGFAL